MNKFVFQTKFGKEGNCFAACLASLFGVSIDEIPDFFSKGDEFWWDNVRAFLKERGYGVFTIGYSEDWMKEQCGCFIVAGKSPRELTHAVIYNEGKMIHDPHPDGGGVIPEEIDIIYKKFDVKQCPLDTHG